MWGLDNRVRISLRYTGSRQFEEAASEGIKQPQIVYVLTWHRVVMAGISGHLETNSAQAARENCTQHPFYLLQLF